MIFGVGVVFLLIALVTIAGALAAALLRSLIHCALSLTITFAGLALLYLNLGAQFAGFAQILVYIGAVAILVVFAILLTRSSTTARYKDFSSSWIVGLLIAAGVFAVLSWAVTRILPMGLAGGTTPVADVHTIGTALVSTYVLPLEIVAVLLTVALIGAVIVAMPVKRSASVEKGVEQ
jgi:NADH-quinone oxidoreductase subunit J